MWDLISVVSEYNRGASTLPEAAACIIDVIISSEEGIYEIPILPDDLEKEVLEIALSQLVNGKLTSISSAGLVEDYRGGTKVISLFNQYLKKRGKPSVEETAREQRLL